MYSFGRLGLGFSPNTNNGPLALPSSLRIVGKGGYTPSNLNTNAANYTRIERRSRLLLGGQPASQIWVAYWNGYITQNGETTIASTPNVGFALEYGGVTKAFTVKDTVSDVYKTVAGNEIALFGIKASAFGLGQFPANMDAFVRFEANGTAGFDFGYPTAQYETGTGLSAAGFTTGSTQLLSTGALTGGTDISTTGAGPHGVFGAWAGTPDISVMIFSDSVMMYKNDTQDNGTTGGGIATRGLRSVNSRSVPHVKYSVDACNCYQFTTSKTWWDFLAGCSTHLLANPGGNDMLVAGKTAAQTLTAVSSVAGRFKSLAKGSKYVSWLALQPATTGTFATLDGQTPVVGSTTPRGDFNTGLDGFVGSTLDAVIDTGRGDFEATNSRSEKVWPASYTNDGIHPQSATALNAASSRIGTAASSWS